MSGLDWQTDALCAQTDIDAFHPDKGGSTKAAKAICARCDVAAQCLAYALAMELNPEGIWGGTTVRERRAMRQAAVA